MRLYNLTLELYFKFEKSDIQNVRMPQIVYVHPLPPPPPSPPLTTGNVYHHPSCSYTPLHHLMHAQRLPTAIITILVNTNEGEQPAQHNKNICPWLVH